MFVILRKDVVAVGPYCFFGTALGLVVTRKVDEYVIHLSVLVLVVEGPVYLVFQQVAGICHHLHCVTVCTPVIGAVMRQSNRTVNVKGGTEQVVGRG